MKTLVLFDFDGTITTSDSMIKFIRFVVGDFKFYTGMLKLSPMLLKYKLKLMPNYEAKEQMLYHFFKDINEHDFKKLAKEYSLNHIDKIVRPNALKKIKWHQQQGHTITLVSASMESWLKPWCDKYNIGLLSTKLEFKNNYLSGKFATKNCYGIEKVNRIKEQYNINDYEQIYAYGDSRGDKEMLELADKQHYRHF